MGSGLPDSHSSVLQPRVFLCHYVAQKCFARHLELAGLLGKDVALIGMYVHLLRFFFKSFLQYLNTAYAREREACYSSESLFRSLTPYTQKQKSMRAHDEGNCHAVLLGNLTGVESLSAISLPALPASSQVSFFMASGTFRAHILG